MSAILGCCAKDRGPVPNDSFEPNGNFVHAGNTKQFAILLDCRLARKMTTIGLWLP